MKSKLKALLVSVLTAGLAFTSLSSAGATTSGSSNGFDYSTDGTTVTIEGCTNACSGALTIPEYLSATSDSPVTYIADEAFLNNINITSVSLPITLFAIGDGAFEANFALESISIPVFVQSIGDRAFYDTRALTSVTFEENSNLVSIGNQAFQSAAFSTFTIPASVETIGTNVFTSAQNLTSLNVENENTYFKIENNALLSIDGTSYIAYPCGLSSPIIPDTVTYIEIGAFYGNGNITTITFPESLQEIGESAFAGNDSLVGIVFNGDLPIGGPGALYSFAYFGGTLYYLTFRSGWDEIEADTEYTDPQDPDAVGLTLHPVTPNRYVGGAEFRGKLKVGKKVSLYRGTWEFISTTSYKFKWYACKKHARDQLALVRIPKNCKAVSKNISSIYKLKKNSRKKYLAVVISAISDFGTVKVLIGSSKKVK